jgi:hypothetical protein
MKRRTPGDRVSLRIIMTKPTTEAMPKPRNRYQYLMKPCEMLMTDLRRRGQRAGLHLDEHLLEDRG